MNFIKKKIKKPKKGLQTDEDDFDPNQFFPPAAHAPEGAPKGWVPYEERLDEDSEEWLAYKQLTSRISETLQKTQDNLTKIVAHSAVPEGTLTIKETTTNQEGDQQEAADWLNFDNSPSENSSKPPPRPPPPKQGDAPPPRPPPPKKGAEEDLLGGQVVHENGFGVDGLGVGVASEECVFPPELLDDDDFGVPPLPDDGDDPFDTSFVDLATSIARTQVRARPRGRADENLNEGVAIPRPKVGPRRPPPPTQVESKKLVEDDPFVYSQDLGVVKSDLSASDNCKMNVPRPDVRSKSPNPFLSDSPTEPSAINPFLNGSVGGDIFSSSSSSVPSTTVDLLGGGQSIGNPFASAVTSNPGLTGDLFAIENVESNSSTKQPSLVDDLFGMETNSSTCLDPFGDLMNTSKEKSSSNAMDLFNLDDAGVLNPTPTMEPSQNKMDEFDFFGGVTSPPKASGSQASSRKGSVFATNDVWNVKVSDVESKPEQVESAYGSRGSSQVGSRRDSGFASVQAPPPPVAQDHFDGFGSVMDTSSSKEVDLFGSVAEKTSPPSDVFGNEMEVSVPQNDAATNVSESAAPQFDVFDAFDSVLQPMNNFDGLPPAQPKVRIEIPMELKQNADVFEALGQRGPKTPVEPLMFEAPDHLDDAFAFGAASSGEIEDDESKEEAEEVDKLEVEVATLPEDDERQEKMVEESEVNEDVVDGKEELPLDYSQEVSPPKPDVMAIDEAAFDAFEARFQSTALVSEGKGVFDPFGGGSGDGKSGETESQGFGLIDEFDPFLTMTEPPLVPQPSPARFPPPKTTKKVDEDDDSDSDDSGPDFSIFIRPKMREKSEVAPQLGPPPALAPPPKSPARTPGNLTPSRVNPFDDSGGGFADDLSFGDEMEVVEAKPQVPDLAELKETKKEMERTESQESPGSPLFEEDDTEPLEDFPPKYQGDGWQLMLRQPNKKKITGQRFWKKVWVRLSDHVLHLYNSAEDKDPFQELPLQACYSISEISAQQYDQYGKIFTIKLQYVFYRERVGVRPGQISKVAHGQITSFGQLAKLGLPLEHAPQVSQLLKLGTQGYGDIKVFAREVEDALFRLTVHRDRALTYKTEEIQVTVQDEVYIEVLKSGHVDKQLARVRVFFLAFITGMPDVEVGLNDIKKKGKEVVGRYDIIPVVTEEWIRLENLEFHSCVSQAEFDKTRNVKLHPPDACFFELLRFRIRPPKTRELPLQVKAVMTVAGNRVELRVDVLVPGYSSRKHGQVPCEDVAFRFLLPECWIYLFRVEKHFRYGSLKSAARKPGKIKGLERLMGAATTTEPSLIEVSTGQAKYEHHHRSIVWRVPRLPKEGQGAYTEHSFVCRFDLTSYDQMPEELAKYIHVEFTMPATTISHTTVRSVSVSNQNPPEKHVRYIAKCEYRVEIEHVNKFAENEYLTAAAVTSKEPQRPPSQASSSSPA